MLLVGSCADVEQDPAQECMFTVLSPELDGVYDGKAPEFEVMISSGCGCTDDGQHEIEIRVSRENNKRHLNATTYMPCHMLKTDGGVVSLVDLRDGFWEGTVAVKTLDLYHDIRFSLRRYSTRVLKCCSRSPAMSLGATRTLSLSCTSATSPTQPSLFWG